MTNTQNTAARLAHAIATLEVAKTEASTTEFDLRIHQQNVDFWTRKANK